MASRRLLDLAAQLGRRIVRLRSAAGLTQEQLAWQIDRNKGYLSRIESGQRLPSLEVLDAIAQQLGVEPHDLLRFDPAIPPAAVRTGPSEPVALRAAEPRKKPRRR